MDDDLLLDNPDRDQIFKATPPRVKVAGMMLIALVSLMALIAWSQYLGTLRRTQPLTITACTEGTYVTPDAGDKGPPQESCTRPYQPRGDQWVAGDVTVISGQVCLDTNEPVSYRLSVSLQSIQGGNVTLLEFDAEYEPGCQDPYAFPYEIPDFVWENAEPGSLGQWRIVGEAVPADTDSYKIYRWDATESFELIVP